MTSDFRLDPCLCAAEAVEPLTDVMGDARGGVGAAIENGVPSRALETIDSLLTGLTTSIRSSSDSASVSSYLDPFWPVVFSVPLVLH